MRFTALLGAFALLSLAEVSFAQERVDRDVCVTQARAFGFEIARNVELLRPELGALCIDVAEIANERGDAEASRRMRERGVSLLTAAGVNEPELIMRAADLALAARECARAVELRRAALAAHESSAGANDASSYPYQMDLADAMECGGRAGEGSEMRSRGRTNAAQTMAQARGARLTQYDWATANHARVLYATTRRPSQQGAHRGAVGQGATRYGEALVNIPRFNSRAVEDRATDASSQDLQRRVTFREDLPFADRQEFIQQLRASMPGRRGGAEVLVFVHGYNTSFTSAVTRAASLGALLEIDGAVVAFSWPSAGRLLSYIDDGNVAQNDANYGALARLLRDVVAQERVRRVYVVAHSMGNRLLIRALDEVRQETPRSGRAVVFDEIVFASPDVRRREFETVIPRVRHLATRMTLYASNRDRALRVSTFLHFFDLRPRVGIADPPMDMEETETVVTTDVSSGSFGHDDFSSNARDDLRGVVWQSQQPSRRCVLANAGSPRVWEFRPQPDCSPTAYRAALWYRRHYPGQEIARLDQTIARLQQSGAESTRLEYHRAARRLLQSWGG
ncbi:MAG: alpha/beta hydrolase [Hyphomonadaceae bacterium]